MKLLYIVFGLWLTACTTMPLQQSYPHGPRGSINTSNSSFAKDKLQCRMYATQTIDSRGLNGGLFTEILIDREVNTCMNELGYR